MLRRGELPGAFKVDGVWRVDVAELELLLEANRIRP
jgi:hypothetical protein